MESREWDGAVLVARGPGACPSADTSSGRGPQDTSSEKQDEVDCGKAGASQRRAESPGPCTSRTAERSGDSETAIEDGWTAKRTDGGDAGGIEEKR